MSILSNSRTGITVQIYGNLGGANPGHYIIKSYASSGTRTLNARPQLPDALLLRYASQSNKLLFSQSLANLSWEEVLHCS